MTTRLGRLPNLLLVFLLSFTLAASAQPLPQEPTATDSTQSATQTSSSFNENRSSAPGSGAASANDASAPAGGELPDAPMPAQSNQQSADSSSIQPQNPASVPSGAAGAKAPTVRGAPASRTVGAAIAPAKQRQRRSLLIKVGLVAGACVAVGSAFALSKASSSKPPGAP
jgi:cytoskeletal protein RodZ